VHYKQDRKKRKLFFHSSIDLAATSWSTLKLSGGISMEYSINALAKLAGITPRTLRWYDETGLLKPLRTTSAGYRVYGPQQVERLQDILFYRELGFELSAIGAILDNPAFDRQAALQSHLTTLEQQRNRLDALILTVQKTISTLQGETTMTDTERFEAFKRKAVEENETKYGKEAREKYGDEAVKQLATGFGYKATIIPPQKNEVNQNEPAQN
jgi:DNA-binding transcriptional MerR regulator